MSDPALVFLPWVDRGGAAVLPDDRPDAHPPNRVSTRAEVVVNQTGRAAITIELMGPGDVTAIAAQQVIRTDPAPGTRTFESNYLALVEFDEPSLPWLFTPAAAVSGRLRPWLCLVVVDVTPGVRLDPPAGGPLPVLRIGPPARAEAQLPDLAESWAWAHAQVATDNPGGAALVTALDGDPSRNLSRLVCSRLLAEQTEYLACVVPTFEAGRRAGLGKDPSGAEGPAWTLAPGMAPVELPVYHHWRFATGPAGDFQSLALAIRARPVPATFGSRPIDLSTAGLGLADTDDAQIRLGGALRSLSSGGDIWSDPALPPRFATALTEVLNTPDSAPAGAPVLAPPRYGAAYRENPTLDPTAATRWYEQLNVNPATRVAAALGVQVVQRDQESLVASAWDQAADLRAARALSRLADAGIAVAERLQTRHLASLSAEAGVFVVAPLLHRLPGDEVIAPMLARMTDRQGLPAATLSATVRRVVRGRGATVRRASRGAVAASRFDLTAGLARISGAASVRVDAGQLATLEVLSTIPGSPTARAWDLIRPASIDAAPPRPTFAVRPLSLTDTGGGRRPVPFDAATAAEIIRDHRPLRGVPRLGRRRPPGEPEPPDPPDPPEPPDPPPPPPPRPDSEQAALFRLLASRHLATFLASGSPDGPVAVGFDPGAVFKQVLAMTAPAATFTAALGRLVEESATPAGPDPASIPSQLTPRFGTPMASALAEIGQEWLLPGLGGVPADTAMALRTNSSFVQAFMIGLNHEFGRELLWREFPTPLDATYFQRFWDNAIDPSAPVDLDPLAEWADRPLGDTDATDERFVLLLRTELLRRFPDAVVTAVRGGETLLPMFSGALVPDVRYFGFAIPGAEAAQWSVVIAEQPSAPRFGFEVSAAPAGVSHAPAPDATSAALAHRLRQLPARIVIPVPVLLRDASVTP